LRTRSLRWKGLERKLAFGLLAFSFLSPHSNVADECKHHRRLKRPQRLHNRAVLFFPILPRICQSCGCKIQREAWHRRI